MLALFQRCDCRREPPLALYGIEIMSTKNKTRTTARELLEHALDDPAAEFRPGQCEAICGLVDENARVLLVQRTGWGKSMVYFLGTRILRDRGRGVTLLISPLLALMRDQIDAAGNLGLAAETVNSTNPEKWPRVRERLRAGQVDILLISPERLSNDAFVEDFLLPVADDVGLLVIDEAHCISDWGHDFRPDYRRIVRVLRRLPRNVPVLAATATANDRVVGDVHSQLGADLRIQRGPLARESLCLQNVQMPRQIHRLAWLADHLDDLQGSGIIYTLTVRDAVRVADWLRFEGHDVAAYYGDVPHEDRLHLEQRLKRNEIKALVATTALGMGYDKPDLGFVVHYQAPQGVVHYYQQVGRAGRKLATAHGILLSGAEDGDIADYFIRNAFPSDDEVHQILAAVEASEDGLLPTELERAVNLRKGRMEQVLKLVAVEERPAIVRQRGDDNRLRWQRTQFPWSLGVERIDRLTRQRRDEWDQIQAYVATEGCLMRFLAEALDDPEAAECGRCANCLEDSLIPTTYRRRTVERALRFLRRSEFEIKLRVRCPPGAFSTYGWSGNLPADLRAEPGRCLGRWGDAGWGQTVIDGKHDGHFNDELVEALAQMIGERWRPGPSPGRNPGPSPGWVTAVPSLRHPELVADLAERLADSLGLAYVPAVSKRRETEPQKTMENAYHQASNLDGVFVADEALVREEPVLLVDDVIDSGWTLTVIAALLRGAGIPAVYPVVLASTGYR